MAPTTVATIADIVGPAGGRRRGHRRAGLAAGGQRAVAGGGAGEGGGGAVRLLPFDARVLPGDLGSASALKACFALQSKALPTVWWTLAQAARRYGVADVVRGELARDGVDLDAALAAFARRAEDKAGGGPARWTRWRRPWPRWTCRPALRRLRRKLRRSPRTATGQPDPCSAVARSSTTCFPCRDVPLVPVGRHDGDVTTSRGHDRRAGQPVPGQAVVLEKAAEPAICHPGQLDRPRAESAHRAGASQRP